MNSFHVRTPLPQNQVLNGESRARSVETRILKFMKENPTKRFCEYDFEEGFGLNTSVRRALSNLKKKKLIDACRNEEKIQGRYGVNITTYRYANPQPPTQTEMKWTNN